ncbi:MAG: response regulator [Thermodesulfobacteriota bacterium]
MLSCEECEQEGKSVAEAAAGKVLIVEDDEYIAELLRYWFSRAGYLTRTVADGLAACSMVQQERPDVILLDLMLPGLDGREVCRLIRRHGDIRIASIPIIMLTALSAVEDQVRGLSLGADLYMPKPYSVRDVLNAVGGLIGRRRDCGG